LRVLAAELFSKENQIAAVLRLIAARRLPRLDEPTYFYNQNLEAASFCQRDHHSPAC
jgi:hypothetical protein